MKKKIGIGLITYDRPDSCLQVAKKIKETTKDANLLCVIDGGDWRQYDDWIFENYTVIVGQNEGLPVNRNRAINYLHHCDIVILIEDDLVPIKKGWVELIEKAIDETGYDHLTYVASCHKKHLLYERKYSSFTMQHWSMVSGCLLVMTGKCIDYLGIGDPRYKGYGHSHTDYTRRAKLAELYPADGWIHVKELDEYLYYRDDLPTITPHKKQQDELERNTAIFESGSPRIFIPLDDLFI